MKILLAFTGAQCLEESVTYQAIIEEGVAKGRLEGVRHSLILLGEELFGRSAGPRAGQHRSDHQHGAAGPADSTGAAGA